MDVPFQDPPPGQQGQVSQMWYPFPTCPVRTPGFVPTIFISRPCLTHTGAHTPSRLVRLQLSASLDTRVSSLPWPITGFLFSRTAPLCLSSLYSGWLLSLVFWVVLSGGQYQAHLLQKWYESESHSPASLICQALDCSSIVNTDLYNGHFYFVLLYPMWNTW